MTIRILVVGDYKEQPSEGMEVITASVVSSLRKDFGANVKVKTTLKVCSGLLGIVMFNPQLIVFTHGPGKGVLILSGILSVFTRAKIIWVSSRPSLDSCPRWLFKWTRVDHMLIGKPSDDLAEIQKYTLSKVHEIIIGIDFDRLKSGADSVEDTRKRILGKNTDASVPLLIHVGHVRHNRGLEKLIEVKRLMEERVEIVIIGSPSLTVDQDVFDSVKGAGIAIFREYVEDLSSIYKCADGYVFPVDPEAGGAVDLPLSVIESLSSGTPVVSTEFGVLPKVLSGFKGVTFSSYEDIPSNTIRFLSTINDRVSVDVMPDELDLKNVSRKIMEVAG